MSFTLPEITNLFSQLALHLKKPNSPSSSSSIDLSISNLTQSLNLTDNDNYRVRVLDTALSLLCFKPPQVFDAVIECSVKTIISVLSCSVGCKVLRFHNEEVLRIGSSISRRNCIDLMEFANDVSSKLEQNGISSQLLIAAVVRVAALASCCKYSFPSTQVLNVEFFDGRITGISKLLCHVPGELSFKDHEIQLRLLFWYLDPLSLKHDISKILQESMRRPFLSLSKEFYKRMDWRSILICLVLTPIMFIDTRALLHDWFLLTGLSSILEFLVELVSVLLDVISRPTWWGLSIELGSKLPFSTAYFPFKTDLLRTLAGPLSSESFLQLVHGTSKSIFLAKKHCDSIIKPSAVRVAPIHNRSIWAMAICFLDWFYFASVLLFSNNENSPENFQLKRPLDVPKFRHTDDMPLSAAAATYIAWILSPANKSNQDSLFLDLTRLSQSWILKQIGSSKCQKGMAEYRTKLKKPRVCDSKEDFTLGNKYDCQVVGLWLEQFQNIMKNCNGSIDDLTPSKENSHLYVQQRSKLFRRIPLGILIGWPCCINEDGCEQLLHYAATGRILQSVRNENTSLNQNSAGVEELVSGLDKTEAVAGACLVFNLTDIVESMSATLFETEETGVDFIGKVKSRAGWYLIKCIKRLTRSDVVEDGMPMLMDIKVRLEQWRHQGQEVLELCNDLDDAINGLIHELS